MKRIYQHVDGVGSKKTLENDLGRVGLVNRFFFNKQVIKPHRLTAGQLDEFFDIDDK
jgi:hypothetical protein